MVISSVTVSVWITFQDEISSVPKLASRNDTVFVQTIHQFFHSSITASTCDQRGDSPHVNRLFLVSIDNLTVHHTSLSLDYNRIDQEYPSAVTGLIENQYLLKGSEISYEICLGSLGSDTMYSYLFLFDDDFNFIQYQRTSELGEQLSILTEKLQIGINNTTQCFRLFFKVPKSSYYFLTVRTPAEVFYTYKYTLNVNYYDHNDYNMVCSIYDDEPCRIDIPGSLFSSEEYALLAYVRPNVALSSATNHMCVSASRSDSVNVVVGMAASIASLALLGISVLIFVVALSAVRHRNRRGYTAMQNDRDHPPPYHYQYGR